MVRKNFAAAVEASKKINPSVDNSTDLPTNEVDLTVAPLVHGPFDEETTSAANEINAKAALVAAQRITDGAGVILDETSDFLAVLDKFEVEIRTQTQTHIPLIYRRGKIAKLCLNIKLKLARDKTGRKAIRAATMEVLLASAVANYDPSVELKPVIAEWIGIATIIDAFPNALNMTSVTAIKALMPLFEMRAPEFSHSEAEVWALKDQYQYLEDEIADLVDDAVAKKYTVKQVALGIDVLNGADPDAMAPIEVEKAADTVQAAKDLASDVVTKLNASKIDADSFFTELQSQMAKYSWTLSQGHTGNGSPTLKVSRIRKAKKTD